VRPEPAVPSEGAVIIWGEQLQNLDGEWQFRYAAHHEFVEVGPDDWSTYMRTLVEARPRPERQVAVLLDESDAYCFAYNWPWGSSDVGLRLSAACAKAIVQ